MVLTPFDNVTINMDGEGREMGGGERVRERALCMCVPACVHDVTEEGGRGQRESCLLYTSDAADDC